MKKYIFKLVISKLIFLLVLISNLIIGDEAFKTIVVSDKKCKTFNDHSDDVFGKTYYSIRPQDSNTARRITRFIPNKLYYDNYGYSNDKLINLCVEYQRTFNYFSHKLGDWFLLKNKNCLTIANFNENKPANINSQQLGLVINDKNPGKFCLFPKIENTIVDLGIGFDLSRYVCNLWTKLNFVLANCKTSVGLSICNPGQIQSGFFPSCAMSDSCSKTPIPYESICSALLGNKSTETFPELKFGKISNKVKSKTELAGIHYDLGYDLIRRENGHLGASLHAVFPTGNRPNGKFLFEPIVGANKCWQVGLGVNSSYDICCDCEHKIGLYFDAILTHLFPARQTRVFNLKKNGPLSQYLLLKKFDAAGNAIGIERVANILAGETEIGADVMFDGSLMLQFNRCNFFANLGYNFWARTKEKRSNTVCFRLPEDTYGIKGDLPLCNTVVVSCKCLLGGVSTSHVCPSLNETLCEPVNSTSSNSTISCAAPADDETVFLKISDINWSAPLHPSVISNKIFASIGYNYDIGRFPIYGLIGTEIEFSKGNRALNQWGVLVKGGISF